jgi:glycerol-3-phosphate O-acyltransferase
MNYQLMGMVLIGSVAETIDDRTDFAYIDRKRERLLEVILSGYDELNVTAHGRGAALELPKTAPTLFVSTHQSHLDYAFLSIILSDPAVMARYPRIIAGTNLLGKHFSKFVRFFTGADFRSMGAIPIERNRTGAKKARDDMIQLFAESKPVAIFPEVWTYHKADGTRVSKVGRSYDGTRAEFSPLLFSGITEAVKVSNRAGYVVPITISYDFVSEDRLFPMMLARLVGRKKGKDSTGLAGDLGYRVKELNFFRNPYRYGKGNIYFDIGQPVEVLPHDGPRGIASEANAICKNMHRISSASIISECLLTAGGSSSHLGLSTAYQERVVSLQNRQYLFTQNVGGLDNLSYAVHQMQDRGLLHEDPGSREIVIRNEPVIKYYANMLAHLSRQDNGASR